MPLLYNMFGEPFVVTLIFFRSGKMYFSESFAPALYGSTNSKRISFMDLLWASYFDVYSRVCSFVDGHYISTAHVVVGKLFAAGVKAAYLICKLFAANHFILKLDVRQLVFQLCCV